MHELLATLSLAESAWHLGAVWIVCGLAVLVGLTARRRLPAGAGEGLFIAGVSGMLLAAYLPMHDPQQAEVQICAVLTALAVLWRFAPRFTEHTSPATAADINAASPLPAEPPAAQQPAPEPPADPSTVIRSHATLVCGAAVAGISLRLSAEASRDQRLAVTLCLMLLLALVLRPRAGRSSGLSWYALLGLLACALRMWALLLPWSPHVLTAAVMFGGGVALLAALVPILTYWRQRRRNWQVEPERLLEPPPRMLAWWTGVQMLAGLTGIAALVVRYEPLAPFGPALACLAASTAGYRQRATAGGSLALVLACETVILASLSWLPDFGLNALAGSAIAGLWMIWLARFWHQQLRDGQPWTYTGQLIDAARRTSYAAAVLCFVLAVADIAVPATAPGMSVTQVLWTGAAFLALMLFNRLLIADAAHSQTWFGPFAGCIVLLAALAPLEAAMADVLRGWSPWPLLLAIGSLLLVLAARRRRSADLREWVYDAYIGGFLPVAIVSLCWAAGGLLWIAILPVVLIGFGLRWPRVPQPVPAATFEPRRE